jgi:hypothetical protein
LKYLFTLLLSILLLAQAAQAQVPGYMGKRAWFTADLNFAPAFFNMNENHMVIRKGILEEGARAKGTNLFAINYRPQFNFEYLVGKNIALGLSYSIIKTGTVKELDIDNPEIDGMYYDILKGNSFGFHMKKFKYGESASIAPIGYYWTLGVAAAKFNTYASKTSKEGQFSKDVINPVVTLGVGKQKVLFDRFLLNSGVEYGWSFLPQSMLEDTGYFNTVFDNPQQNSIHHAFNSMLGYYLFNIKVSVGMLAF